MTSHLLVISGLPGVGKTCVADLVAARSGMVQLSIDAVEEALLACGLPKGWEVGVAAYEAIRAMAEQNLRLGHDVVIDAVNDSEEARQTWRTAASNTGAELHFVHLVVSDQLEHASRLSGRDRGLAHVGEPTWPEVERRRGGYAEWTDEALELDTAGRTVEQVAGPILRIAGAGQGDRVHVAIRRSIGAEEYPRLVRIWRGAVDATHDFLADEHREEIEERLASDYFPQVELYVADVDGVPVGFAGVAGTNLEMLFVDAGGRGRGIGTALVAHVITASGVTTVDVNEQNAQAVEFYRKRGFGQVGRDEADDQGRPYPILHLALRSD